MATTTRIVPLGTYPSGSRTFGPSSIVGSMKDGFAIHIGRCTSADPTIWSDPATIVNLYLQFSYDNRTTWTPETDSDGHPANGIWNATGGIHTNRSGEVPEEVFTEYFTSVDPQYINGPTDVKGRVEVINGPIKTYVDLTLP